MVFSLNYKVAEIESESKFIWKFILNILLTPVILIMVLFGKKNFKEFFKPFNDLFKFIIEPKFTITIIIITMIVSFYGWLFLSDDVFSMLINYPSDILNYNRWFSLISSGFLHANIWHLLSNMLGLFIFGRVVEKYFGFWKTSIIFFIALLISSIGDSIIGLISGSTGGSLGISGALMGLVAAAMLVDPLYITYELLIPLPIMVVGWITIYTDITGILSVTADGVAHFAHLFGYLSITIILFTFSKEDKSVMKKGLMINLFSFLVALVLYFFLSSVI